MPLISHSTPRWIAIPLTIALSFMLAGTLLAVFYFVLRRELGWEAALLTWLIASAVLGSFFAVIILRDHASQAAFARDSMPVVGVCERFGKFTHAKASMAWRASEIDTVVGSMNVGGRGSCPSQAQIELWDRVAPRLPDVIDAAFEFLFSPDPEHYRRAGFGLLPLFISIDASASSFTFEFTTVGFPPRLSLEPVVVFDDELRPTETDWNIGP